MPETSCKNNELTNLKFDYIQRYFKLAKDSKPITAPYSKKYRRL